MKQLFRRKNIINSSPDNNEGENPSGLHRILSVKDLTFFGIAAIIGAGIFSTIGRASYDGGPAVSILFLLVAVACVFTALCYAQFSSMIPVSGSAYTYAYASLGEIFAWIIGWALILEYAVSNMVVAISWSEYFTSMLKGFGIHWPEWLAIDAGSASRAYEQVMHAKVGEHLPGNIIAAAKTYETAPVIGNFHILFDLPAGLITVLITALVFVGIRESKNVSNWLVILKLGIIALVIGAGAFFVKPENWSPFAPNGVGGILKGVAAVFFAFIGFDSISTTAEECKNPQRDMPRAMIYSLIICTVLYILISFILTGMVNYKELRVDDPLAFVFGKVGMNFIAGVISVSAVIAITSALLVYQIGQPRIWMTMSRDGLLGKKFGKIHHKYKTPSYSTIITGILVGLPAMFLDMQFVVDLTSVGTFFAFIMVCSGILYLDHKGYSKTAKFKIPYVNGKYLIGILLLIAGVFVFKKFGIEGVKEAVSEKPLLILFAIVWAGLSISALKYKFSLIPILGILFNLYLMTELGLSNWLMFVIWLAIGLVIYFTYGYKNSKLNRKNEQLV
ncbi:amino acid permease [Elizabethkingia meningoseptica]|uniref:amino acid permease n=1 Tax=Elizabethkingia meningoseptica TaxID=238 RepID=UPI000937D7CC|nr:amino acid permease [Elizabethkingia meningoseptica]MDE5487489.1 amino acid permease [Elizabethkingia meningoseptica]MVW90527.1 amino acid permease [Elizabethkingia meningoseptica]